MFCLFLFSLSLSLFLSLSSFHSPTFFRFVAAYCGDFEQFCPGGLATPVAAAGTKCLKVSTFFLGPNLRGTPFPTKESELIFFPQLFFSRPFLLLLLWPSCS